MANQHN